MKFLLTILILIFTTASTWAQLFWQEVYNGLNLNNPPIICSAADGNIYALGSITNDRRLELLRSNSNGDSGTWVQVPLPANSLATVKVSVPCLNINGRDMYIIANDTLWWSDDYATTWKRRSALPDNSGQLGFIPFVNIIYYKGSSGLYKSMDQGLSWNKVSNIPINWTVQKGGETYGFSPSHVQKSTNGGANWIDLNAILPSFHWQNIVLLSNDSFMIVSGPDVYTSADAINWTLKRSVGIPTGVDECVSLVKAPNSDSLFISVWDLNVMAEIFYSSDLGSTWNKLSLNIPADSIDPQPLYIANGYIFTAGPKAIICRTSKPLALATKDITKPINSTSIHPNPFSNDLTIENWGQATVTMFDLLGQLILRQNITSDKQIINTDDIAPGSYILQLIHTDGSRQSYRVEKR